MSIKYHDQNVGVTLGGGEGGGIVLSGTDVPQPSIGNDGDIYLQYEPTEPTIVLPTGYTRVKYIAASGNQYIQTGVPARQQLKTEVDFQYTGTAEPTILGGTGSATSVVYLGINPSSSFKSYYFNWAGSWVDVRDRTINERHTVITSLQSGNIVITEDGNEIYSSTETLSGTTAANNLTIFARNGGSKFYVGNLYRLRIWDWLDNGNLIRDYIPAVRDSDDAVGLYELVQGQFCENSGTGTLTAGAFTENEITNTYAKVNGAWQSLIGTSILDINI